MWLVLTVSLLFLAGGIVGFYLGWTTRAREDLYREDGPAQYRADD